MLALKKKREAEKKKAAESGSSETAGPAKVSLLGVGGKKTTKGDGSSGRKRSPGEIRIQKGKLVVFIELD